MIFSPSPAQEPTALLLHDSQQDLILINKHAGVTKFMIRALNIRSTRSLVLPVGADRLRILLCADKAAPRTASTAAWKQKDKHAFHESVLGLRYLPLAEGISTARI